jgi:hypothetical protein
MYMMALIYSGKRHLTNYNPAGEVPVNTIAEVKADVDSINSVL